MEAIEKAEGTVIIRGDFNFVMDLKMDTTATRSHNISSQLEEFKQLLEKYQMVDLYRHQVEKIIHIIRLYIIHIIE